MGETDLIHALILQFLQHDGYVETARAFAEDIKEQKEALNLDPNVTIEGINIRDDKDAHNRQRVLTLIPRSLSSLFFHATDSFFRHQKIYSGR